MIKYLTVFLSYIFIIVPVYSEEFCKINDVEFKINERWNNGCNTCICLSGGKYPLTACTTKICDNNQPIETKSKMPSVLEFHDSKYIKQPDGSYKKYLKKKDGSFIEEKSPGAELVEEVKGKASVKIDGEVYHLQADDFEYKLRSK